MSPENLFAVRCLRFALVASAQAVVWTALVILAALAGARPFSPARVGGAGWRELWEECR